MVVGVYVVEGQGIDSSKWCFTVYVNDRSFQRHVMKEATAIFIMKDHTSYEQTEREELQSDIASGSLKDKDVTFYNAGECELSWDTNYYDLGKQVKSWTEINGMVSEHAHL